MKRLSIALLLLTGCGTGLPAPPPPLPPPPVVVPPPPPPIVLPTLMEIDAACIPQEALNPQQVDDLIAMVGGLKNGGFTALTTLTELDVACVSYPTAIQELRCESCLEVLVEFVYGIRF